MLESTSSVRSFLRNQCKLLLIALLVMLAVSPLIGESSTLADTAHITIEPSDPREGDEIRITISGEWRNACPSFSYSHTIFGDMISFQVTLESKRDICAPVVTPWFFTENVGKLSAGTYTVEVEATDTETGQWGFHDSTTFDVSPTHWIYLPLLTKNHPPFGHEVVELINRERLQRALPALSVDGRLMAAAEAHSQDMAIHDFVGHLGSDGSSPWDRISRAGYPLASGGEVIGAGYSSPESAVAGWMGSSLHRAIILGDYRSIGVGYSYDINSTYYHYWTADLAVPR